MEEEGGAIKFPALGIKNTWINYHLPTMSMKEEPYRLQSVSTVKTVFFQPRHVTSQKTQSSSDPKKNRHYYLPLSVTI
jgi:hypothetical protein